MDGLEVSIVESERDFRELYELEESVYGDHGRENMCLGIARVDDVPAGYWKGTLQENGPFVLTYFYIDEKFRGRGYGNDLMAHQLSFAKSIGYATARSVVLKSKLQSLAIHKKLGGYSLRDRKGYITFEFDLIKLNF